MAVFGRSIGLDLCVPKNSFCQAFAKYKTKRNFRDYYGAIVMVLYGTIELCKVLFN